METIYRFSGTKQKTCPDICRDRNNSILRYHPAWCFHTHSAHTRWYAAFLSRRSLLRLTYSDCSFLIALGSPFGFMLYAVIAAPTALWDKGNESYSLFLIGFHHYITVFSACQAFFQKISDFFRRARSLENKESNSSLTVYY